MGSPPSSVQSSGNELRFDAALSKQLIDAQELLAQALVVNIALDSGQRRREPLLNGEKRSWH